MKQRCKACGGTGSIAGEGRVPCSHCRGTSFEPTALELAHRKLKALKLPPDVETVRKALEESDK